MKFNDIGTRLQTLVGNGLSLNTKIKLLLVSPFLLWVILYSCSQYIPSEYRPEIDVTTLPSLERHLLFGHVAQRFPRHIIDPSLHPVFYKFLDVFAAFLYALYFIYGFLCMVFLYLYWKRASRQHSNEMACLEQGEAEHLIEDPSNSKNPHEFKFATAIFCAGIIGMMAISTQNLWPTTPPWYTELYGTQPASFSMHGFAADLIRVDKLFHMEFFQNLYMNSPVVFGAFPSLHVGHPALCAFLMPTRTHQLVAATYPLLVAWAALYLNHHWLIDVIGGTTFAFISYYFGSKIAGAIVERLKSEEKVPVEIPLKGIKAI